MGFVNIPSRQEKPTKTLTHVRYLELDDNEGLTVKH
jgi:hypothetical protein